MGVCSSTLQSTEDLGGQLDMDSEETTAWPWPTWAHGWGMPSVQGRPQEGVHCVPGTVPYRAAQCAAALPTCIPANAKRNGTRDLGRGRGASLGVCLSTEVYAQLASRTPSSSPTAIAIGIIITITAIDITSIVFPHSCHLCPPPCLLPAPAPMTARINLHSRPFNTLVEPAITDSCAFLSAEHTDRCSVRHTSASASSPLRRFESSNL